MVFSYGIPNCAFVPSKDFFVCPEIITVVDLQIESVRDVDLLVFDVPTPREHLHVCPLTVATATQYAVYLLNRDRYIDARLNYGSEYNMKTFVACNVSLMSSK